MVISSLHNIAYDPKAHLNMEFRTKHLLETQVSLLP